MPRLNRAALAAAALAVAFPTLIRPWYLRWGATAEETGGSLPGDSLVPDAVQQATRAITIQAPPEAVWPWIVQVGQGRGGLYSYDALENLLGCDIHSVGRIIPELQELKVGDPVRLVPRSFRFAGRVVEDGPMYEAACVIPNQALLLRSPEDSREKANFASSWAFILNSEGDGSTRLIIRSRNWSDPAWMAPIIAVEPLHFLMEQKMLRGIKARAERTPFHKTP